MEIHQFVHSYVDHDATATHARHLQRIIREMGIASEVYAGEWRGALSKATSFRDFPSAASNLSKQTWLLYQFATASPIAAYLADRTERVAINYHNITPYDYLAPWEPAVAPELNVARGQLRDLVPHVELGIGVSRFNESELIDLGCKKTAVAPVLFDPSEFSNDIDKATHSKLQRAKTRGGADILFVGRLAPHKCQHHLIAAFAMYQRFIDPLSRLHLVGGVSSHRYWTTLNKYVESLSLTDHVTITKGVSSEVLGAYYRNADVFVCLSEHEGFGVPLLEAMHHNVPVVAFDAAAIGETMGDAGILLDDKSPAVVAQAWDRVLHDDVLAQELRRRGRIRMEDFSLKKSSTRWRSIIENMVSESP